LCMIEEKGKIKVAAFSFSFTETLNQ
jgi:hypothetical protein